VFYLQIAWFIVMVVVAAKAPAHRDSEFVFRTWINNTGWESNVICFITGLVNPLYSLGGLDGITHITEEMPNVRLKSSLHLQLMLTTTAVTQRAIGYSHHPHHCLYYWIHLPYCADVLGSRLLRLGININWFTAG
jgi:hypothetical protein